MTFPVTVFDFSTFLQGIHCKDRQSSGGGYQVTCGGLGIASQEKIAKTAQSPVSTLT